MVAFKKILVPCDDSRQSDMAIEKTVQLVQAMGGGGGETEVILFHVVETIPLLPVTAITVKSRHAGEPTTAHAYIKEVYYELKASMTKTLEEKKARFAPPGVSMRVAVAVGDSPADRIVEFARQERADLIVMGRVGVKGLSRVLKSLGSVSRSVAERAPCPVMIVQ